jgi:predicted secreted protein
MRTDPSTLRRGVAVSRIINLPKNRGQFRTMTFRLNLIRMMRRCMDLIQKELTVFTEIEVNLTISAHSARVSVQDFIQDSIRASTWA